MGTGIAIVAAKFGNFPQTHIIDSSEDGLSKSRMFIEKWLDKEIKRKRWPFSFFFNFFFGIFC